jgi:hypothetical protein
MAGFRENRVYNFGHFGLKYIYGAQAWDIRGRILLHNPSLSV